MSGSGDGTSHCCIRFGSPSMPSGPSRVCAIAAWLVSAAAMSRAKNALKSCMNSPDGRKGCGSRFVSRIPGESNPVHFSVNLVTAGGLQLGPIVPCEDQLCRPGRLDVLFRHSQPAKTDAENPQVNS